MHLDKSCSVDRQPSQRVIWRVLAATALTLAGVGWAQAPGPGVSTLPLSSELTAWGRIGGVAVDRLGFVYVSNFGEDVWKVAPDGSVTLLATGLYGTSGNVVDERGNLLQASFFADSVSRISRTGEVETLVEEGLDGPVGLALDDAGELFICNCNDNTIARFDGQTTVRFAESKLFACPNGLAFDDAGNLYVTSFSSDQIVQISTDGLAEPFATVTPPDGYSEAALEAGVEGNAHITFAAGRFFVTKIKTNQVYSISREGEVRVLVGGDGVGLRDGDLATASLSRPNGIAAFRNMLFVNNLDGPWRSTARGRILLRVLRPPSL